MVWIALSDHAGGAFATAGLGASDKDRLAPPDNAVVRRGTIMIETRFSELSRPQTLLAFRHAHPFDGGFSLRALPRGGITLAQNIGADMLHATLDHGHDARADLVRITYCWDCEKSWARLSLERLDNGQTVTRYLPRAHPLPFADMRRLARPGAPIDMDSEVVFVAMADHVHPTGPLPGLCASVPVATPSGPVPAACLRRGDTVCTADGDIVPVLQTVRLTVPARGTLRPIRLRAPFFGLNRDTHVAPHQRLVMSGSQVDYMFATSSVLVPARHLVNDSSAFVVKTGDVVTYHHILLPAHKAVMVDDCQLESLYIGRLRRNPKALSESVLAHCSHARLPEHARPVSPVLKPFEAITLARANAA